PGELQVLHIRACDFVERAVAPSLIVAANHQPVAGIRIAKHRVGDRREVLHFAGNSHTAWRCGAATESSSPTGSVSIVAVAASASRTLTSTRTGSGALSTATRSLTTPPGCS